MLTHEGNKECGKTWESERLSDFIVHEWKAKTIQRIKKVLQTTSSVKCSTCRELFEQFKKFTFIYN